MTGPTRRCTELGLVSRQSLFWLAHSFSWPVSELGRSAAMKRTKFLHWLLSCAFLYLSAFAVVHCSSSLRRPAANMRYWYYSDSAVLEAVEFFGFWPIRNIGYRIPGLMSRHYLEATPFRLPPDAEAGV